MQNIAQFAKQFSGKSTKYSIIEFAEKKSCLNIQLYPQQRFLLRVFNKEQLDTKVRDIELRDKFGSSVLHTFTEFEFYDYLYSEGRASLSYDTYLKTDNIQILLAMGRRATKSTTISVYVAYKLYEVLNHYCPQDYFKILPTDTINVNMVALGEESAAKLFTKFVGIVRNADFFKPFILEEPNSNTLKFWTSRDLEKLGGKIKNPPAHSNSISIFCSPNTPGVRGDGNMFCVLDEFAHFNNSSKSTRDKPLDEAIYQALTPSLAAFKYDTGEPFGKTLIFSSPNGRKGKFYKEYALANELKEKSATLSLRAATWEMNPGIHEAYFRTEYNKDPRAYNQEYGAEFDEDVGAWIRDLGALHRTSDKSLQTNTPHGRTDIVYYLGVDFALSNDGTAICVSHYDPNYTELEENITQEAFAYDKDLKETFTKNGGKLTGPKYVLDYFEVRYAGKPPYEGRKVLLIEEILDWIEDIYRKWPIRHGIYDQWSGQIIEQLCKNRNIRRFEMLTHNAAFNDSMYKLFYMLLNQRQLKLAYAPQFLKELQTLHCENLGNGVIKVGHPAGDFHDDLTDAVFRSLYLAFAYSNKDQNMLTALGNTFNANNPASGLNPGNVRANEIMREKLYQTSSSPRNPRGMFRNRGGR